MIVIDKNQRPTLDVCPEKYCFFWSSAGQTVDRSGVIYGSVPATLDSKNREYLTRDGCTAPFGPCKRGTSNAAHKDWYEPDSLCLDAAGLPELFFCNVRQIGEDSQDAYKAMEQQLWGSSE